MRRWNRVRERLQSAPKDFPERSLWQRIEASRLASSRLELPSESWAVVARAVLYGILLGVLGLTYLAAKRPRPAEPLVLSPFSLVSPLLPEVVLAQGNQAQHFQAILPLDGSKVRPGRWVYAWNLRQGADQGAVPRMADTITIRGGIFHDQPAWVITTLSHRTSGLGAGRLDSLYLRAADLAPLRSVVFWYRPQGLVTAQVMDYTPGLLRWQFRVPGGAGRDTVVTLRLPAHYAPPTWFSEWPILLSALELRDRWSGAVPFLFPNISRLDADSVVSVYWVNLRVAGRKRVTVAAGTFDCWRVVLSIPPEEREDVTELWIDRKGGFVVQESPGRLSYSGSGRKLVAILP